MNALKKLTTRLFSVIFCAVLVFSLFTFSSGAKVPPESEDVDSVLLYSISGNKIIYSKGANTERRPAAMTKILSGLMLCEELSGRREESITLTAEMLKHASGRMLGLAVGDRVTVHDLLRIAVCGSYNDAYCALAVLSAGSYDAFIMQMNERARVLGATSTEFDNPVGLDSGKMLSTATDVLAICRAANENELYMALSSTYSYTVTVSDKIKNIENRNELHNIYGDLYNENALGFAAGMTDGGGYCVATKGVFGDAEYICIIMGADEGREYELASSLLTFASENYSVITVKNEGDAAGSIPLELGDNMQTSIPLVLGESMNILIGPDHAADDERTFRLVLERDSLRAPVKKGETVGYMIAYSRGELLACVPVVTACKAEKNSILSVIEGMKEFTVSRIMLAAVIFFIIALIALIIIYYLLSKKKRRRPVYARGRYK